MNEKTEKLLDEAENQSAETTSSVANAKREFAGAAAAEDGFAQLKTKLLQVNRWNAHSMLMNFALFDENGNQSKREAAAVGDFIRLTLTASGKSDWVKIVRLDAARDEVVLSVRPTYNPTEKNTDRNVTSHFFTGESTNNFCLARKGETINFYVVGLDEKTNTDRTKNILETVRNAATANLGHFLGIQKMEWTQFCENFLKR